jgi:hypothetical protein
VTPKRSRHRRSISAGIGTARSTRNDVAAFSGPPSAFATSIASETEQGDDRGASLLYLGPEPRHGDTAGEAAPPSHQRGAEQPELEGIDVKQWQRRPQHIFGRALQDPLRAPRPADQVTWLSTHPFDAPVVPDV